MLVPLPCLATLEQIDHPLETRGPRQLRRDVLQTDGQVSNPPRSLRPPSGSALPPSHAGRVQIRTLQAISPRRTPSLNRPRNCTPPGYHTAPHNASPLPGQSDAVPSHDAVPPPGVRSDEIVRGALTWARPDGPTGMSSTRCPYLGAVRLNAVPLPGCGPDLVGSTRCSCAVPLPGRGPTGRGPDDAAPLVGAVLRAGPVRRARARSDGRRGPEGSATQCLSLGKVRGWLVEGCCPRGPGRRGRWGGRGGRGGRPGGRGGRRRLPGPGSGRPA